MRDLESLFAALRRSTFRAGFRLGVRERSYLLEKGMDVVRTHAADFVARRLAPAAPARDGRQTPFSNHPVFVAQHATATCCRDCLQKWHGIPKGRPLDDAEQAYVVTVITHWLAGQLAPPP